MRYEFLEKFDFTQQTAKRWFCYNTETGKLTWLVKRGGKQQIGDELSTMNNYGYVVVGLNNRKVLVHDLIWLWMTGRWPQSTGLTVDHINRNRSDNRWENLRLVTKARDLWNRVATSNNTGVIGVYQRSNGKYRAHITRNGRMESLGEFSTIELAINARQEAEFNRERSTDDC